MRINLRHGATAAILAAAFSLLGSAAQAAAIPGTPAVKAAAVSSTTGHTALKHDMRVVQGDRLAALAQPDQVLLPASSRCHEWDSWKYDSCRHDGNKCTFKPDYVYYDKYSRYNEEGYYHCTVYPHPTPYARP